MERKDWEWYDMLDIIFESRENISPANNNKSSTRGSNSQPPIINKNNADKLESFINLYGNKEYNMKSENPQYYNNNNGWNTHENDNYFPQKRRPKSAHSVGGEARPKSSASSVFDGYYYEPGYETSNNYTYL